MERLWQTVREKKKENGHISGGEKTEVLLIPLLTTLT